MKKKFKLIDILLCSFIVLMLLMWGVVNLYSKEMVDGSDNISATRIGDGNAPSNAGDSAGG